MLYPAVFGTARKLVVRELRHLAVVPHTRAGCCACIASQCCLDDAGCWACLLAGVFKQGADSKPAGCEAEEPVQADHRPGAAGTDGQGASVT